jgi:RNA polymerase primary sigma factor
LKKINQLTKEEEKKILLYRFRIKGDKKAIEKLIKYNRGYIYDQAKRLLPSYNKFIDIQDLIQEGTMGFVYALKRIDMSRKTKILTYSSFWIKAYMYSFIEKHSTLIRIPAYKRQEIVKGIKDYKKGFCVNDEIKQLIKLSSNGIPFDSTVSSSKAITYSDYIKDENVMSPDIYTDKHRLENMSDEILSILDDTQKFIIKSSWGIGLNKQLNINQISEQLGDISPKQIRLYKKQALNKLKRNFNTVELKQKFQCLFD